MAIQFSNLASTTLASGVSSSATSVSVTSASLFPSLGGSDYFYATLGEDAGSEIVKVTAISGTTFTVVRAQDGTSAISHNAGTHFALRVTAAALEDLRDSPNVESVSKSGDTMTGALLGTTASFSGSVTAASVVVSGTVDGRDVATDGTKLDGIEASATADQTGAQIKTAYQAETNAFTDAQFTKLGGIEALATVTNTASVTAAGALMDSELTSIASVKALNQGVSTGNSPTFAALTSTGEIIANGGIALGDNDKATFGASDDLQIYHNGSESVIHDSGTGNLDIRADSLSLLNAAGSEYYARFYTNGSANLYHNGSLKLTSTSTGIDVTGTVTIPDYVIHAGNTSTKFGFGSANTLNFISNGSDRLTIANSYTVFNEAGTDYDFRVESNDNAHMLFVDGGNNRVGVGSNSPDGTLHLDSGTNTDIIIEKDNAGYGTLRFHNDGSQVSYIQLDASEDMYYYGGSGVNQIFYAGGSERMRITNTGLGINNSSPVEMLTIGSTSDTNVRMQFLSSTSGGNTIQFGDGTGASAYSGYINYTHSDNALAFATGSTERMRLISTGVTVAGAVTATVASQNPKLKAAYNASNYIGISHEKINVQGGGVGLIIQGNGVDRATFASGGGLTVGGAVTATGLTVNGVSQFDNYGGATGKGRIQFGNSGQQFIEGLDTGNGGSGSYLKFGTGSTERMRISSAGNVGISNSAPSVELALGSGGGEKLHVYHGGAVKAGFGVDLSGSSRELSMFHSTTGANGNISFGKRLESNGAYTEKMRLNSTGLGIGLSSPASLLHAEKSGVAINSTNLDNGTALGLQVTMPNANFSAGEGVAIGLGMNGRARSYLVHTNVGTNRDAADLSIYTETGGVIGERVRVLHNGNVLIGKSADDNTTAGTRIHAAGYASFTIANDYPIIANRLSSDGDIAVFRKDGSTVGSIGTWDSDFVIGQVNVAFKFDDGSNKILPWSVNSNLNRDNAITLGAANTRWKDLYLAGGVYLGGTGAANKLDDYEEGTWTPAMTSTNGAALTMVARYCRYTKVGRMVHIYGVLSTTSLGSASGNLRVHGLPFTAAPDWDDTSGVLISQASGLNITAGQTLTGWVHPNGSYFNLQIWNSAAGTNYANTGDWSANGSCFFSGHYSV